MRWMLVTCRPYRHVRVLLDVAVRMRLDDLLDGALGVRLLAECHDAMMQ